MLDTQTIAPATDIPSPEHPEATVPAGFTREYEGSPIYLGERQFNEKLFDGLQIVWHEHRGFELTVSIDADLTADHAHTLSWDLMRAVNKMKYLTNRINRGRRSIWKRSSTKQFRDLWAGPGSHRKDVGLTLESNYTPTDGLRFWFALEQRPTEQYTPAEMWKIYRAIGQVLDKVSDEPFPGAGELA